MQSTLAESDENFLVLFTENETIRSLLAAHLKDLHNTNQAISDLSRQSEQLSQKGTRDLIVCLLTKYVCF